MLVTDTELQDLTVLMYGKKYELHPAEDLELHPSSVGDHLQEQASRFAFYATIRDMCKVKVEARGNTVSATEAVLSGYYRGESSPLAKTTEEAVKQAIRGNAEYLEAKKELADAEMEFDRLNSITKAFEHRREMLIEMARRANNTTWNDKDVDVTVAATITPLQSKQAATKGVGKHPSKQ